MVGYILRRLIQAFLVVIIITAIVFFAMRLMPGDPILIYLSGDQYKTLSQAEIEQTRHELGLDRSIVVQYFDWVTGIARGDLGDSLTQHTKVSKILGKRMPVTLYLNGIAFIVGNLLGVAAGVISAMRRGKMTDLFVTISANIGITIPSFLLAITMMYVLSLKLGWLPTHGFAWPWDDFIGSIKYTIMPVITLSIFSLGALARQTRSVMLEVVRQDYVRTAYSKGLEERKVIVKHVLKNGLIPIVTIIGMQVGGILGGSVIVEKVYNISGMGSLAVDAIYSLDYAVTQAIVLISALMIVAANLLVDISYGWLDPRVRYD